MTTTEQTYRTEMQALAKQLPTATPKDAAEIKAQAAALTRAHIASTQVRP